MQTFSAIGTSWTIDLPGIDLVAQKKIMELIHDRIAVFDKNYSRFRDDSLVSEMGRKAGTYILPDDAQPMLDLYKKLYDLTGGKVTPLIGQVLVDAGYDAEYSLKPKTTIPPAKNWNDVLEYHHPNLTLKEPALLDFGALGKGYLVDIVAKILDDNSIANYTINAGGDIAYKNTKNVSLKVGLEHPDDATKAAGVATIINQSICGSAGNRRKWSSFHHIIDPQTVTSPSHIKALWIVADTTLLADGLATALFFVEPTVLLDHFDFEYAILYSDHTGLVSNNFPGNFFN